jgi:serine/threonine protein kinase
MARILIIDDDRDLASAIERWLLEEKHTITMVHSGNEGLNELKKNRFDLVILDWHMPDIYGIEVLREFRQTDRSTPVIMLTANTKLDAKEEGLDSGASDYVTKPFSLRELSARIRAAFRNKPPQLETFQPLGRDNEEVLVRGNLLGTALAAKYEFIDILGEGAWGIIFRAHHPLLDKPVAIKMMRAWQIDQEAISRFQTEARAVSRLDHPTIVRLYDFGITEHHSPYMVMEFVEGQNLDQMLEKFSSAPPVVAVQIMTQMAEGLAHAHSAGIIHRDIKPSNVMLKYGADGRFVVKILDFGLARLLDKARQATQGAQFMYGSPLYIAPEVIKGADADARSDIYSCGCILFELITGDTAVHGTTLDEVFNCHISGGIATLQKLRPDLGPMPDLQAVLNMALHKDPGSRFQTAAQFEAALSKAAQKMTGSRTSVRQ